MAEEINEPSFTSSVPGQAMTTELGARPWQRPPLYTTVDDAIQYYIPRIGGDEFSDALVEVLDSGVPVSSVANSVQLSNVMDGKHSADVGILITPVLMELMMLSADTSGIKYNTGLEEPKKEMPMLSKAIRVLKDEEQNGVEPMIIEPEVEVVEEEPEQEKPQGLMARRI